MYVKPGMPGRRRRRYTEEFKARVTEECRRPEVLIAAVALANGLNANLLRKWVAEERFADYPRSALPFECCCYTCCRCYTSSGGPIAVLP
jgi:hypothetical protein